MLFKIMDLRAYHRGYDAYQRGLSEPDMAKRPKGAAVEQVRATVFELAREKIERARQKGE